MQGFVRERYEDAAVYGFGYHLERWRENALGRGERLRGRYVVERLPRRLGVLTYEAAPVGTDAAGCVAGDLAAVGAVGPLGDLVLVHVVDCSSSMSDIEVPGGGLPTLGGDMANQLTVGREFDATLNSVRMRLRVKSILRGSVGEVDSMVIPQWRDRGYGIYHLGLYRDPEVDPRGSLIVAFELQRVG